MSLWDSWTLGMKYGSPPAILCSPLVPVPPISHPKVRKAGVSPCECMSQGTFAPLPDCLIPNAKGPLLSLTLSYPGDMKGHRAMQVAKAAGGGTPGLSCCSALQGPGAQPPFCVMGQASHQF